MKQRLLNWLVCPECHSTLDLKTASTGEEIEEGVLSCVQCRKDYPIVRGIPRFVPMDNYAASFGRQWNRFARLQLDSQNGTTFSRDRFYSITEWKPSELQGKAILDAGCGAGRFSEVMLQDGAEVIAVDLSSAVEAARANLGHHPHFHPIQASIYALPFRPGKFETAYCIGVIQHTPDPRKSVLDIAAKVAPGGRIGLWIYELSWKSFVGTAFFKYAFRPWTRRMSHEQLENWCRKLESLFWPLNRWARHQETFGKAIMRMLPTAASHLVGIPLSDADFREWVVLDSFDMYSPAHDQPQTFATVKGWLESDGFNVDQRHPHGAVSITATRRT